jgi:hypothetical protein
MASEGNALLLKTSEITARLAGDLVALQSARRTGNDKEKEKRRFGCIAVRSPHRQ